MGVVTCKHGGCGEDVPILAKHLREATFDHHRTQAVAANPRLRNLRLSPDLAPSIPALTERQAKVCALILEGMTDRAIARALFVAKPTVRKEVRQIANVLCADEPIACRVFPRQTIVAYHASRSGLLESDTPFGLPA
jgi:DNA-binding NarL/FixJ family response regulator